jgi:transposase InsO family protein
MPWEEVTTMSLRREFVQLAQREGANIRALCRRYGISPPTAYKWLGRARAGDLPLADRPRRPATTPRRTAAGIEAAVLAERDAHPAWGARKLRRRLANLGHAAVPAPSTIHAILRRHGRIDPTDPAARAATQRFEHPAPNALWQMDFKGHVPLGAAAGAARCHPLTVLDDHSRFALGLEACADETAATVRGRLTAIFRRFGLPDAMLMDNGAPWGDEGGQPYTILTAWLIRLGIRVAHGRPRHPQTQGKDERFHRTLKAEVLRGPPFADLAAAQARFDRWRATYNLERPHQALAYAVPADRYRPSARAFPDALPPIAYGPDDLVRRVFAPGRIRFHGRDYRVGRAFVGQPVALRPTTESGIYAVYYCHQPVTTLDARHPTSAP